MKNIKFILWMAFSLFASTSQIAHAQFSVIRGVNPSSQFVNLNADTFGNIAVNCVIGCGASSGTAGVIANGAAVAGVNPIIVAGYDGVNARTLKLNSSGQAIIAGSLVNGAADATANGPIYVAGNDGANVRTLKTDTSGQLNINVVNTPAVTVSGTPNVSISNTPAVTLASTTLSGTTNNVIVSASTNTLVDKSGTITTGGTSQTLSAAKSRHYFFVQNLSTANLYINFTSAASAGSGSIVLLPNSSFVQEGAFVSSELITIFGATTGQAFTAKDF